MTIKPIKTKVFLEGEDLYKFIISYIHQSEENSIIAITSKIVALSENRTALNTSLKAKNKLIKAESKYAIPTKLVWLTIKDNLITPSAGIDESNANGKLILLPKNSYQTAIHLRNKLKRKYQIKNLGIIITDSRTLPLRAGVVGLALGYAGFVGVKDYRGQTDIFGRKFHYSRVDIADSLATAATLMMGEGDEQQPLAIITNAPVKFCTHIKQQELVIPIKDDMYYPLLKNLLK